MLFDKQRRSLVRSTWLEFGEVQDAEFTAGGDSADPTQGRPRAVAGCATGTQRLGFDR